MRTCGFLLVSLALLLSCRSRPQDPWRPAFDACKGAATEGTFEAADARCSEALKLARRESPPGLRVALSSNALGVLYLNHGRFDKARPLILEALTLFEASNAAGPNEHYVALLTNVGDLELREGNAAAAEPSLRRAVLLASQLQPPHQDLAIRGKRLLMASLCSQRKLNEAAAIGEPLQLQCNP